MQSELIEFETYVTSLTEFGVFPTLIRHSNGWSCVLKNSDNKQLMPFSQEEPFCWGETMMKALTLCVEKLNSRFAEPRELHKYIETGDIRLAIEPLKMGRFVYSQ